jgi:HlyD family secretion protein
MKANALVHAVPLALALALALSAGCASKAPTDRARASGSVEATEVQISSQVGGRLMELKVAEGDRVAVGQTIAQLDTTDILLVVRRATADRDLAAAQLALLVAGSRQEDIRQADAQLRGAEADTTGARDDLAATEIDLGRFDTLLKSNSGTQKQRDDAAARRDLARSRLQASQERVLAARQALTRLERGARPEEIAAARARLAATEAQIASLEQNVSDATVISPVAGIVTQTLADAGEILAPRTPIVNVVDLDHAWANIYIDEPLVPRLRLGQQATIFTDAGGAGLAGTVTFISPKAEFTPRNVQTAEERSKLVYRIKVSVDNTQGILKPGMPVEADVPLTAAPLASPAAK